ncbi:hypothetical protein DPX16_13885 [Anabarilius grahami]|uniref:TRIM8/14/16/25/29/45/65 coiled-coil region domain-containing protein n=1 Tax=Anabarilius grahami TaxID=495550 RepID=A0A3N0XVW6_ANAGA|nr:hypothetical protein DPX16_13885 [Anabarilius grahami]
MSCITGCWNQEDQKGVYSCPQCRQTFTPRPALAKNVVFAEMLEKLKKTRLQTADCYAGSGDVECDVLYWEKTQSRQVLFSKILKETQRRYDERIQEIEKEIQDLRQAVDSHKRSAQAVVENSESIFTELIRSIEKSRTEVTQLITDQEKAAVSQAEGLLKRLEQEIDDLRRRDAVLEQISHTHYHIHFLQYSVSDTMTLIHKVQTTFALFWVWGESRLISETVLFLSII